MLATHTIDPEDLYTITSGGFSATADAFARDDNTDGLWFVSMVGSQTALKAIWASLLKQPPDTAHIIRGADGMALSGGYQRCQIPYETIGTWTTCRYCKHDHTTHLTSSGQPHFYRPATEAEKRDPSVMLYRHTLSQGGSVLVRRMVVANHAELVTAFCTACAESIGTHQVLCYQRNVGVGEVVGVQTGHRDMAIAA